MVFLIPQSTQNRNTAAMQIKLDEIIRAIDTAHNALLDLEELDQKKAGNSESVMRSSRKGRVITCAGRVRTSVCPRFATKALGERKS
ncbi:protein of unknown function (plasmid) [Caballeronia sp. S22]